MRPLGKAGQLSETRGPGVAVAGQGSCELPVAIRLYLPEAWPLTLSPQKRGVAEEIGLQTKPGSRSIRSRGLCGGLRRGWC